MNGFLNAMSGPCTWNTNASQFGSGWWNLTVCAIYTTGGIRQDQVFVFVYNMPSQWAAINDTDHIQSPQPAGTWLNLTGMCLNITIARPRWVQLAFTAPFYVNDYDHSEVRIMKNGTQFGTGVDTRPSVAMEIICLMHAELLNPGSYEIRMKVGAIGGSAGDVAVGGSGQFKVLLINAFDP